MKLRIVSWNIQQGGGSRIDGICESLSELNPDILVLQEFRNGKHSPQLIDTFDNLGLTHRLIPNSPATKNCVVIASRVPFEINEWPSTQPGANSQLIDELLILSASFNAGEFQPRGRDAGKWPSFTLIAAHLPHKKAQIPYFEALLNDYLSEEDATMIIGDLNCGIPFIDSETKTFTNTHLFQELLHQGWIDSWRSRHQDSQEFSWVSSRGNGYRYDHCLCSRALDKFLLEVAYVHNLRKQRLSDHSALMVSLG